jgi:hypothetical protein
MTQLTMLALSRKHASGDETRQPSPNGIHSSVSSTRYPNGVIRVEAAMSHVPRAGVSA